jgi:hypothetical protein
MVRNKAIFAFAKFFFNISWCDQVTATPEDSNKIVFNRGILIGLNDTIERGGQACPISIVGEILL